METTRMLVGKLLERDLGYDVVLSESEGSKSRTPLAQCKRRARECDIYIGILGYRYGWVIPRARISVTEMEFNEARKNNPYKILAYVSAGPKEPKQEEFVRCIEDFAEGYFRREPFRSDSELTTGIREDLADFMKERLDLLRASKLKVRPTLTPSATDYVVAGQRERAAWMKQDAIEVAKSLGFKPVDLFPKRLYLFTGEREVAGRKTVLFSIWVLPSNLTHDYIRSYTGAFQEHIYGTRQYNKYCDRFTIFLVNGNATTRPLEKQAQALGRMTCFKVEPGLFFGVGLDTEANKPMVSLYENMLFLPQVRNKEVMVSKLVDALEWLDKEAHRINFACNYIEPLHPVSNP
jgi:hypothetical protein